MLSSEEVAGIARRAFEDEDVEVLEHRLLSHSSKKVGFLGDHKDLEITAKSKGSRAPKTLRLFVKTVPGDSKEQQEFISERGIFSQEALCYNTIMPLFRESFVGESWYPQCYLANDKLVVLEDLRHRGFAMLPNTFFDGEHLSSALRAQARLHAASLLAQSRLGQSPAELYPEACVEQIYSRDTELKLELYIDFAERVAQLLGRDKRRIRAAMKRGLYRIYRAEDYPSKLSRVFCHGDSWPNNYLFDASEPPRAVLLDFQLTRFAPRMFDVAHLTYLSTSAETRRRELGGAIEAYHEELCDCLEKSDPELERPSLDDLLEEFEDVKLSGIFIAVLYAPVIWLSQKSLGDCSPEVFYQKVMLREDNNYVMELYEQDVVFGKRISEVINEMIDYSEEHEIAAEEDNEV